MWRQFASNASATFAREVVSNFRPSRRWPTALERLRPIHLRKKVKINEDCAGVLYDVQPEHYSDIATRVLDNMKRGALPDRASFFTVCAYDPRLLHQTIQRRFEAARRRAPKSRIELRDWALEIFDHFQLFARHAAKYPMESVRILLVDDFDTWTDRLKPDHWWLFGELNGGVPCWGIDRASVNDLFLTDFVVFGGQLLLDYYDESRILVISDLSTPDIHNDLLGLLRKFGKVERKGSFRPFKELDKAAQKAFKDKHK